MLILCLFLIKVVLFIPPYCQSFHENRFCSGEDSENSSRKKGKSADTSSKDKAKKNSKKEDSTINKKDEGSTNTEKRKKKDKSVDKESLSAK